MKLEKTSISSAGLSPSAETLNPRYATPDDVDHILSMARDFFGYSPYNGVEFDEEAVRGLINQLIVGGCMLVHDKGFLAGMIHPLFFSPSIKIAVEMAWWAPDANGGGLREMFEVWAKENGASAVQISTLNNKFASSMAQYLTDRGFTPVEVGYMKVI